MKIIKIFTALLLIFWLQQSFSQDLPKANEDFATKNYVAAETGYRTSTSDVAKKSLAIYNLGNAIYKQNFAGEARFAFSKAAVAAKNYPEKHNAYHNLGNSLMLEKKYDLALEAYKNALRNNPEDEETRYNFALAKKKDKDNPNKDKDKKKDKKDKKDKKEEDKKEDPKKSDEKDKPKPEPSKASQEQLKNLMEAVNNEEKKVQAKINKGKQKGEPVQTDKDW